MATRVLLLWTKDNKGDVWVAALERSGFVAEIRDRDSVRMNRVREARPDAILVDMHPPREAAIRCCRDLRRDGHLTRVPILAVASGRAGKEIRAAVAAGADGGLEPPLQPDLLAAKIRAWMKREPRASEEGDIRAGAMTISQARVRVYIGHRVVPGLSLMEFRTLQALAERCGRTLTRRQIMAATHDEETDASERSVDVLVVGLRKKLGASATWIESVRGVGYRLVESAGEPDGTKESSPC